MIIHWILRSGDQKRDTLISFYIQNDQYFLAEKYFLHFQVSYTNLLMIQKLQKYFIKQLGGI